MGHPRVSTRFRDSDAVLATFVPIIGLLTFPHRWVRPDTPLHWHLRRLGPSYSGPDSPRDCFGDPYGPFARTEVLFNLAGDLFAFSVALFVVGLVALGMTSSAVARTRPPPHLALWTSSTTALSVLAWAGFWLEYL